MTKILIILPNTLFEKSIEDIKKYEIDNILIMYDKYYFNSNQHKQKLVLWFSAIQEYKKFIKEKLNIKVEECLEFRDEVHEFKQNTIYYIYSPLDKYTAKKYKKISNHLGKGKYITLKNRSVILSEDELKEAYNELIKSDIKSFKKINIRHTDFYKYMRVKYNILLENNQKPEGGYWSYDVQNRQRFDKKYTEKKLYVNNSNEVEYAKQQVNKFFKNAYGECDNFYFPSSFKTCKSYFLKFIHEKLINFGKYQDAISKDVYIGEHANISGIMNIGLITPDYVINKILTYYYSLDKNSKKLYINSVEGFIRQVLGWREYMRFCYHFFSPQINKSDYMKKMENPSVKKIHKSWFEGTTGIFIFDNTIKKIIKTGYAHHIERLMVLNNSMFMYGFSRNEVHKWFMKMFIDSYEWVMVGCVSMNHNSLNEKIRYMNRVYIAGDNYIKKMSDYKDKESLQVIQALFKSFAKNNSTILKKDYNLASYIARFT